MPPTSDLDDWSTRARDAMSRYAEPLLRTVTARLIKPRTNQPLVTPESPSPFDAARSRYWREPGG